MGQRAGVDAYVAKFDTSDLANTITVMLRN